MKKSFKKSNMNRVSKREYIMEFFYYLEHPEERQGDWIFDKMQNRRSKRRE